jgi:hypothetical protein
MTIFFEHEVFMNKRNEVKESRTVEFTCLMRVMWFYEQNLWLKDEGHDAIVPLSLPKGFLMQKQEIE